MRNRRTTMIIAEAGSNHNGSLKQAKKLIDAAAAAGCSAVKFQIFRASTMYPDKKIRVKYLKDIGVGGGLYELIKRFEVPYEWIKTLSQYAGQNDIEFMASPFDLESVKILYPYVRSFKIASYECMYKDLIDAVKKTGRDLYISTGGCSEGEINLLVSKILKGYLDKTVLLHCIAKYPTPLEDASLNMIPHFAKRYRMRIGYSDHTQHPVIAPVLAVGLGAVAIEKHFTLSRKLPGPDHAFAVEPDELKEMVRAIRLAELALGNRSERVLQKSEQELYYYKRCLYCKSGLPEGHKIARRDIIVLRNTGRQCKYIDPSGIDSIIGRRLKKRKEKDEVLTYGDLV